MKLRLTACALLLLLPSVVHAQDPTPLEITIATCIGPGFVPDGDPFELIASLPARNCVRACKAAAKGCMDVVKAIDKCGVSFLDAAAKTGVEICRGLGGTSQECRAVTDAIKPDIDWWKAQGKLEQADCDADMQTFCLSRCQSAAVISVPTWTLPPTPTQPPQGGSGTIISVP